MQSQPTLRAQCSDWEVGSPGSDDHLRQMVGSGLVCPGHAHAVEGNGGLSSPPGTCMCQHRPSPSVSEACDSGLSSSQCLSVGCSIASSELHSVPVAHASSRLSTPPSDNHERQVQELRQLQRLKELEQKRVILTAGGASWIRPEQQRERHVELLTKRGAEDLPPFLLLQARQPLLPAPPPPRRSRSPPLDTMADRELLSFLERSTGAPEELKPSNSSRLRLWQVPPDGACREPGEPRGQDSSLAHRPRALEARRSPHPATAWASWLPAAHLEDPACTLRHPRRSGSAPSEKEQRTGGPDPVRSRPHSHRWLRGLGSMSW